MNKTCLICGKNFITSHKKINTCSRKCGGKSHSLNYSGKDNWKYKEFKIKQAGTGMRKRWYIRVEEEHPFAGKDNLIPLSHYVAECYLERFLEPHERIHHIDENRNNDFPENLYVFSSQSEHCRYHNNLRDGKEQKIIIKSNLF